MGVGGSEGVDVGGWNPIELSQRVGGTFGRRTPV